MTHMFTAITLTPTVHASCSSLLCMLSAGTPLEVQKRSAVVPLLYSMTVLWFGQIVLASMMHYSFLTLLLRACAISCRHQYCHAVYGTVVVHIIEPNCWVGPQARSVVHVTQGMAYTTWALTALLV